MIDGDECMVMKKSAVIGLVFIALMLLSTFAYAVIQAFNFGTAKTTSQQQKLPDTNVFSNQLTADQENYIIQNQKTLAKFYYPIDCLECTQVKSALESMANAYKDQVYVQEMTRSGNVSLTISSIKSEEQVSNFTSESIFNSFCRVMYNPPISCALGNV